MESHSLSQGRGVDSDEATCTLSRKELCTTTTLLYGMGCQLHLLSWDGEVRWMCQHHLLKSDEMSSSPSRGIVVPCPPLRETVCHPTLSKRLGKWVPPPPSYLRWGSTYTLLAEMGKWNGGARQHNRNGDGVFPFTFPRQMWCRTHSLEKDGLPLAPSLKRDWVPPPPSCLEWSATFHFLAEMGKWDGGASNTFLRWMEYWAQHTKDKGNHWDGTGFYGVIRP